MTPPPSDNLSDVATLAYRVAQLEGGLSNLERKVDRLIWALVSLTITIAGSAVVFSLTVTSIQTGGG